MSERTLTCEKCGHDWFRVEQLIKRGKTVTTTVVCSGCLTPVVAGGPNDE